MAVRDLRPASGCSSASTTSNWGGEAAEFDTRLPHWFGAIGDHPAEVLSLFGPQGERMHVRARPKSAR